MKPPKEKADELKNNYPIWLGKIICNVKMNRINNSKMALIQRMTQFTYWETVKKEL